MNAYFVCTGCSQIVPTNVQETHYNECLDKQAQSRALGRVWVGASDNRNRNIVVKGL